MTGSATLEDGAGEHGDDTRERDGGEDGDDRRARLRRYLARRAADGDFYCKSKFIADDVDMSTREVGALLAEFCETAEGPHVEKWAYTGATTWRVVGDG